MKIRKYILLFLMLCASLSLFAQRQKLSLDPEENLNRKGKFYFVPEFWLSFGTSTYIEVAPLIAYHLTDRLSLGLGPHYIFQSQKANYIYSQPYSTHIYGGKIFSRYSIIRHAEDFLPVKIFNELFIHAEYEAISLEYKVFGTTGDPTSGRFVLNNYMVGGGFTQRVGMHNAITFMILWNLNESYYSPYSNPIFRIGFNAYL